MDSQRRSEKLVPVITYFMAASVVGSSHLPLSFLSLEVTKIKLVRKAFCCEDFPLIVVPTNNAPAISVESASPVPILLL